MGEMQRRGVAAYRQTMNLPVEKPDTNSENVRKVPVQSRVADLPPTSNADAPAADNSKKQLKISQPKTAPQTAPAAGKTKGLLKVPQSKPQVQTVPDSKDHTFEFLEEFNPEQLYFLLKDESPATAALVLARLPPKVTAGTLGNFPPGLKPEILKRIARQSGVAPEVLERVAQAIREKARHLSAAGSPDDASNGIAFNGMQALTAILKQGDYSLGDRIINEFEADDPEMGRGLKEQLYSLDDVLDMLDRPLAEKLNGMEDRAIAILLKGRSREFREKILSNVSAGRRNTLHEEDAILGAVPKRECDEAADNFMAWFRQERENGGLILSSDEEWVV